MNSNDNLLKCIVCQDIVKSSLNSFCEKGHIHCRSCAISLDGACGLCDEPIKMNGARNDCENFKLHNKNTELSERNDDESISKIVEDLNTLADLEATKMPYEASKNIPKPETEIIEGKKSIIGFQDIENPTLDELQNIKTLDKTILKAEIERITIDTGGTCLNETLMELHKKLCKRNCKTYESCISKLILRIIDQSTAEGDVPNNVKLSSKESNAKQKNSLMELLEAFHMNFCDENCKNAEICLSSKLNELINENSLNSTMNKDGKILRGKKCKLGAEERKKTILDNFKNFTNVVQVCYRPFDAHPPLTQFEVMKKFSNAATMPSSKDSSLPFIFETGIIECPISNCKLQLDNLEALAHLQEHHKLHTAESMNARECKTFYIDPSTLEYNENECVSCFLIPKVFEGKKERTSLPIFVMVSRINLNELLGGSIENCNNYTDDESQSVEDEDESVIEAEIAAAIYGTQKKLRSKPVVWKTADILLIWPIAPIPRNKVLKTVLSVFVHNKPTCHRSVSFLMRSMQDSRKAVDLVGSPDVMWLKHVEVDALTNHGHNVIQCQIMCSF